MVKKLVINNVPETPVKMVKKIITINSCKDDKVISYHKTPVKMVKDSVTRHTCEDSKEINHYKHLKRW